MPPDSTIDVRLSVDSDARLAIAAAACSCADDPWSLSMSTSFLMMSARLADSIDSRTSTPLAWRCVTELSLPSSVTSGPMPPASVIAFRLPNSPASA